MKTTFSNVTREELDEKLAEREKQAKCPSCGAMRDRIYQMERHNDSFLEFIRQNQIVKRDSCILCVEKHLGKAKVLFEEMLTAKGKQDNADARIKVEINHLEVIGNLQAATDEAQEFIELWDYLLTAERAYRYEGIAPDWEKIAGLIIAVKDAIDNGAFNKEETTT